MICPKCACAMYRVQIEGYEVLRCGRCEGLWFQPGEDIKVKAIPKSAHDIDCAPASKGQKFDGKRDYPCPACVGKMIAKTIPEQRHIQIESCEKCEGTFFDAGEFTDFQEFTLAERVKSILCVLLKK